MNETDLTCETNLYFSEISMKLKKCRYGVKLFKENTKLEIPVLKYSFIKSASTACGVGI